MLLHPLENTAKLTNGVWEQKRPFVVQEYGYTDFSQEKDPETGKYPYGLFNGYPRPHNGMDFRTKDENGVFVEREIFAPCDGEMRFFDDGEKGFGKHIRIRNGWKCIEIVLAHLSSVDEEYLKKKNNTCSFGDIIGKSGDTGNGTAPHLHFGVRNIIPSKDDIWRWGVKDVGNAFYGYIDPKDLLVSHKR